MLQDSDEEHEMRQYRRYYCVVGCAQRKLRNVATYIPSGISLLLTSAYSGHSESAAGAVVPGLRGAHYGKLVREVLDW